ncbi:hypothetical protein FHS96_000276 [Sphingomonas zeicaulis]|uniref:hypothetical protein n=1 Tax=Sphingomonas zeicaulis TaxID=1632740 RepID=UPI003D210890
MFIDLILGNAPILTYSNWESAAPSRDRLESRIDFFIVGAFGPAVAKRVRATVGKIEAKKAD